MRGHSWQRRIGLSILTALELFGGIENGCGRRQGGKHFGLRFELRFADLAVLYNGYENL
jgi:hypothetical protein